MNTVPELFFSSVKSFADRTAVVEGDRRVSYGELGEMVRDFSSFLQYKGVKKGDRIAILLPNSVEFAASFFGAASIGAVSVPINSTFGKEEVRFYAEHSGPKLMVTDENLKPLAEKSLSAAYTAVTVVKGENVDRGFSGSVSGQPVKADIMPGDEAVYLYSTGSTGRPKRVSRTHYNLAALADNHTSTAGWTEEDRILFAVPLSHTYGFGNFISAVKIGAAIVVTAEFNRNEVLNLLERESITVFPAVPVMLDILSRTFTPKPVDLPSLKLVISAGAPLQERTFRKFHEKFSIYPRQLYGSTETGVISINFGEDIEKRFNSVGRCVKNVTVKFFDEEGEEVPRGEVGEIAVRSPSMTWGYYGLPEESSAVFRNGYYFTGDLGRMDRDGFIYIAGRKRLFINVGGNKVDPVEVEDLLSRHPKVEEAVVLGVKDKGGSECVKAVIVPSRPVEVKEISEFCRGRIADYKIPRIMEFRDELPRSPTGKVLREKLK